MSNAFGFVTCKEVVVAPWSKKPDVEFFEFGAVQRNANLVDLEKRCKMSIWLQKSASIQPRTSPYKLAKSVKFAENFGLRYDRILHLRW